MAITEKELDKILKGNYDIDKLSKVSSDGKNLLTRIPKEIIDELKIKKGYYLRWTIKNKKLKIEIENGR